MNNRISKLLLVVFVMITQSARGSYCDSEVIKKVSVLKNPLDPQSGTFEYKYQYFLRDQLGLPTIILLPGGPGGAGIFNWSYEQTISNWGLQTGFRLITVDPRGVGCNELGIDEIERRVYSTQTLAADVAKVIETEQLENYIVLGGSYGTQWGTYLFKVLQLKNIPLPSLFIFQGTLGKSWPHQRGQTVDFEEQWTIQSKELDQGVVDLFRQRELPLSLPGRTWASFIKKLLGPGTFVNSSGKLVRPFTDYLNLLVHGTEEDLKNLKTTILKNTMSNPTPVSSQSIMSTEILCREIRPEWKIPMDIQDGNLISTDQTSDFCLGIAFDNEYDSTRIQITVPIIYVEGGRDPSTPPWQSSWHFHSQHESTLRVYIQTPLAGHGGVGLGLSDCKDDFWAGVKNLLKNREMPTDFLDLEKKCILSPKVTIKLKDPDIGH